MRLLKLFFLLTVLLSLPISTYAFRVYPTTAQDERMLDKSNFPFIAANADGFNLQHDCFAPFSASQVEDIFEQFTNKNLINHGVYHGTSIYNMSTMTKLPSIANVTAFMLYNEAPAMDEAEWDDALSQGVTWPLITHCRSYSTSSSFSKLRAEILKTSGIMMEFKVTDPGKYDDAAALMKYCVDNDRMVVFLTTFQQTPDIFMAAYKEFYYYLKENLGAAYLDSEHVIFVPNTYEDSQVFPETLGYGSTFGVAHWLIDQKTKTSDGYIQPTVNITSPKQDSYFKNHKNLTVYASVNDITPTSVKLYLNGELVGEDATAPYSWSGGKLADLTTGYQELRVDVTDDMGVVTSKAIRIKILKEAPKVPGFFKADNLASYQLRNDPHEDGYIRHVYGKEWIDYEVDVEHAGIYDVDVTLKVQRSKQYGGTVSLKKGTRTLGSYTTVLNDPDKTTLPNFTETPDAQIKGVNLTAGLQTIRAYFSRPGGAVKPQFYLYDFNFKLRGAPSISFTSPTMNDVGRYPDFNAPAKLSVSADVTSPRDGGSVKTVKLYIDDVLVKELTQKPYVWDAANDTALSDVEAGEHILKIVAVDDLGYTSFEKIAVNVIDRQPFSSYFKLPGIVKAYQFDIGGEGVAYHDFNEGPERGLGGEKNPRYNKAGIEDVEVEISGGQYAVSAVRNGEWLNYTMSSIKSSTYDVIVTTAANANKSAEVKIWLNNELLTSVHTETTSANGFNTYKNFTTKGVVVPHDLTDATIRVEFVNPDISNYLCFFRQFQFKATGDAPAGVSSPTSSDVSSFSVYPNPSNSDVIIDLTQLSKADVSIYDMNGRQVYVANAASGRVVLEANTLETGTYLVQIMTEDGKRDHKKLVVL